MRGLFERFAVVLVVFGVFAALVTTARAGAYEDALPKFTLDSFSDTADAIDAIAASGSPLAPPLLQALKDQRLLFSASAKQVLIKAADLAMYHAKASGRSGAVLFEPRMLEEQEERRALEEDLRAAVHDGDFQVFYQPLVDVSSGRITSFEALLRWPHPTRGMIAPETFIPLAEETGLIVQIGEWVLRKACMEAASWPTEIAVSVNLSPLQFRNPALLSTIVNILGQSGLNPQRLQLEITETALLGASQRNGEILRSLRSLGVRIVIDDFGTGYSSMSYLQNFEIDKIKIDRRFVQGLETGTSSAAAIIQAIINLSTNIGVGTTAEGVETEEQLNSVLQRGCTEVQGYLFSRPLTAEDARAYVTRNSEEGLQRAPQGAGAEGAQ